MRILEGCALDRLPSIEKGLVQCCVTSPLYWGLRDYKIAPRVWGGDSAHNHVWSLKKIATEVGKGNWTQGTNGRGEVQPGGVDAKREPIKGEVQTGFCECGAWFGCFGLEPTPELYIRHAVLIFREVRNTLRSDGTLWINIGDSYARNGGSIGGGNRESLHLEGKQSRMLKIPENSDLKEKDLVGIPWMLAFALRADGWYLRQEIIWAKPNPMPESVTDRCTKSHESLFLLSKSPKYYFDHEAIKEPCVQDERCPSFRGGAYVNNSTFNNAEGGKSTDTGNVRISWKGSKFHDGKNLVNHPNVGMNRKELRSDIESRHRSSIDGGQSLEAAPNGTRNKRDVWTVATQPLKEAHFATFPPKLVEPCILAGCPEDGTVLDPFAGSGTTGLVALRNKRNFIGIELNPEYIAIAKNRLLKEILS